MPGGGGDAPPKFSIHPDTARLAHKRQFGKKRVGAESRKTIQRVSQQRPTELGRPPGDCLRSGSVIAHQRVAVVAVAHIVEGIHVNAELEKVDRAVGEAGIESA